MPEARQRFLKDPYHKDRFSYDEHSDSFSCPQGQTLAFVRIQHVNGDCTGLQALSVRLVQPSESVPKPRRLGEASP